MLKFRVTNDISRKAIKNMGLVSFYKGLSFLVSFFNVPILINCLDENVYGLWIAIISIVSWLSLFDIGIGNGLKTKLSEFVAKKDYGYSRKLVSSAYFFLSLIFGFIALLVLILLLFINVAYLLKIGEQYSEVVQKVAALVVVAFSVKFVLQLITPILIAVQYVGYSTLIELIGQVLSFFGVLFLSFIHLKSLICFAVIILYVPLLTQFLFTLLLFKTKFKYLSPSINFLDKKCFKDIFSLGIKFFIIQVSAIVLFQTNNFLIARNLDLVDVTRYNIAYQYFSVISFLWISVNVVLFPSFTSCFVLGNYQWIKKTVRSCLLFYFVTIMISFMMLLGGKFILVLWLKKDIGIDFSLLLCMMFFCLINIWNNLFGNIVGAIGKLRLGSILTVFSALAFFPLFFFFKKCGLGVNGAVLSMIVCVLPSSVFSPLQVCYFIYKKNKNQLLTFLLS